MQKKPKQRMDEIELAESIFDEIVEETESEDWNKEKRTERKYEITSCSPINNPTRPPQKIRDIKI